MIDQELINILTCPNCKGPVKAHIETLICEKCMLAYRVEDDIPVMLLEEAEKLGEPFSKIGGESD